MHPRAGHVRGDASMESRRCAACGQAFRPRSRVPQQRYCGAAACRRDRRRRWQRAKRESDADYRENQARAQRAWAQNHRDYWRAYRLTHPQYCESNRKAARQRQRDRRRAAVAAALAKMDASTAGTPVPSGTYRLVPAAEDRTINPDLERFMAKRMGAPGGPWAQRSSEARYCPSTAKERNVVYLSTAFRSAR